MIRPVIVAYAHLYLDNDEGELGSGDDQQRTDLTGSTGGQFEVAANRDHQMTEIMGRRAFGFGPPDRRA